MALVHTNHSASNPRRTHRCHPVLLKLLVSLVGCTLLNLEIEAAFASFPGVMKATTEYVEPARMIHVQTHMATPISESGYASGLYPVGQPTGHHQSHNGQPIPHQTPNHPAEWSANPTLRFLTPLKKAKTGQFGRPNFQLKELWIKIKLDVNKILRVCTTLGSGFSSRHSSFSHITILSASCLPRSASLQIDVALKKLKDTPITINPNGATWAPLDFLPGYEKSDHYIHIDGNCLFRAFAHFKYGNQGKHAYVKREIIEYMLENPGEFGEALEGEGTNLDKVNRRVAELGWGAWGDEPEIKAFVNKYKMNLVVVSKSSQSLLVNVHHSPNSVQNNFKGIVLEHAHYELLQKGEDLHVFLYSPIVEFDPKCPPFPASESSTYHRRFQR